MATRARMEDLWKATDYRRFLKDWLEEEKLRRPSFSIRNLAKRLSVDSSLLTKVLLGERHLSTSRIQPVCDLVGLTGNGAEYFRHMVLFAKSKSAREAQACFERMQELRRIAPAHLEDAQESYWDSWLNTALRSLLSCGNFADDWERMGSLLHPRQSARKVRETLRHLEKLGMVRKTDDGFWKPSEPFVRDRPGTQARAIRNFHRQNLLLAADALETLPVHHRDISSVTVAVTWKEYPELVAMIEDLRSRVMAKASRIAHPEVVLQMGLHLIPVAGKTIGNEARHG